MNLTTTVQVKQGKVCGGKSVLPNGKTYFFFKGIPYAEPPVGQLRFQAPVPIVQFPSPEIDCTKDGNACTQKTKIKGQIFGTEDCLYHNIFVPESAHGKYLPVMVLIHEGGYCGGSSRSDKCAPFYLMQEDVIVVTFNYRLGAIGFLALPEANIPGNAGLKDQRLVLQWINENIFQFNGDHNNVTLFGTSAGSACVHLHMLSQNSKNLFHKAILESGTATTTWAMQANPSYKAIKFAQDMGCTSDDPFEVSNFLRSYTNLNDFLIHDDAILSPNELRRHFPLAFRPVVEEDSPEAVVTETPINSICKADSIEIPLILGYNSGEGLLPLSYSLTNEINFDQDLGRLIPWDLGLHMDDPDHVNVVKDIRDFYFNGRKVDEDVLNNLCDLLGDYHFILDTYKLAEIHSRKQHKSPLFFYRFDYVGELGLYKKVFNVSHLNGACHADEIKYIIQSDVTESVCDDRDKKMTETMCKLWANFAKFGNPIPKECGPIVDCIWEPVMWFSIGQKNQSFFDLDQFFFLI